MSVKTLLLVVTFITLLSVSFAWVSLPYKTCGKDDDHIKIASGLASSWPPERGHNVTMQLDGTLDEQLTGGEWQICIYFFGIKALCDHGPVQELNITLPSPPGAIQITNVAVFPSDLVTGQYRVDLSATDQHKERLFCTTISFTIREDETHESPRSVRHRMLPPMSAATQQLVGNQVRSAYFPRARVNSRIQV